MKAEPTYFPTTPLAQGQPETDMERLIRLRATAEHWGAKSGRHAREQESWFDREARRLARKIAREEGE